MSFLKPPDIPQPTLPTPPPPVLAPQGTKSGSGPKKPTQSFLGSADIANQPQSSGGQVGKTLLGE